MTSNTNGWIPKLRGVLFAAALIGLALLVFRAVLAPNAVLFTTDDNIGALAYRQARLPQAFFAGWNDSILLGYFFLITVNWTNVLLWLLPLKIYMNWVHALDLVLASLFLVLFLRQRGRSWRACGLAVLAAFWVGTNLTLTYAGHIGKFGVLMFSACALYLIEKAVATRRWTWSILAGGAVGAMFLEQQDVALFTGIFLGAYALFAVIRREGLRWKPMLARLTPMGVTAFVLAIGTVVRIYAANVGGAASTESEDPNQQWEFCTQWSVPPSEMLDFVAPGLYGWRSGDPEAPYWGRTGQSAGWEATKQGFRNFRLESVYVGAIPVSLALLAVFLSLGRRRAAAGKPVRKDEGRPPAEEPIERPEWRTDVWFWGGAALLALLLSFGKYFPLYALFYQLPGISSIRCPNKFIHAFQIAVAILSACGLDIALEAARDEAMRKRLARFSVVAAIIGLVLLFAAGILVVNRAQEEQIFAADGWGASTPAIVENMVRAIAHGGILLLVCAAGLYALARRSTQLKAGLRGIVSWGLVGVVIVDVLLLAQHYVQAVPLNALVGRNAVVRYLQEHLAGQRVVALTQAGFYNNWLTFLFPYYDISAFNVTQMPRMPSDYKAFLTALSRDPIRLWQLSAAGYALAPAQIWTQLQKQPAVRAQFEPVFGFDVYAEGEGLGVEAVSNLASAQHLVLRVRGSLPRFALRSRWEVLPDDAALRRLADPKFDPGLTVVVAGPTEALPAPQVDGASGTVSVRDQRMGDTRLQTSATSDTILLAVEKYFPAWKAFVDGKPARVLRCNYLCFGVLVPAGTHEIELRYQPDNRLLWPQAAGALLCALAAVAAVVRRRKGPAAGGGEDAAGKP